MGSTVTNEPGSRPPTGSARSAARARRRRAWADFWSAYRKNKMGMAGLIIVLLFVAMAVFAPLLADPRGLQEAFATGTSFDPPSLHYPLGTDSSTRPRSVR